MKLPSKDLDFGLYLLERDLKSVSNLDFDHENKKGPRKVKKFDHEIKINSVSKIVRLDLKKDKVSLTSESKKV